MAKKIMFSDRFGLTDAVLSGQKTMTRRLAKVPDECYHPVTEDRYTSVMGIDNKGLVYFTIERSDGERFDIYPAYQIGEEVAVAQNYEQAGWKPNTFQQAWVKKPTVFPELDPISPLMGWVDLPMKYHQGWSNKMFVMADLMPHRIKITDIKFERLNDITEEDCRKEGIICVNFRQWLKQELDDFSPQKYIDHDVWTLPIFRAGIENGWEEQSKDDIAAYDPKTAFTPVLLQVVGKLIHAAKL